MKLTANLGPTQGQDEDNNEMQHDQRNERDRQRHEQHVGEIRGLVPMLDHEEVPEHDPVGSEQNNRWHDVANERQSAMHPAANSGRLGPLRLNVLEYLD